MCSSATFSPSVIGTEITEAYEDLEGTIGIDDPSVALFYTPHLHERYYYEQVVAFQFPFPTNLSSMRISSAFLELHDLGNGADRNIGPVTAMVYVEKGSHSMLSEQRRDITSRFNFRSHFGVPWRMEETQGAITSPDLSHIVKEVSI